MQAGACIQEKVWSTARGELYHPTFSLWYHPAREIKIKCER